MSSVKYHIEWFVFLDIIGKMLRFNVQLIQEGNELSPCEIGFKENKIDANTEID